MNRDLDDSPRLGPGTSFDGVLSFEGTLRVDGQLAGAVLAHAGSLVVGAGGRVNARIEVAELVLAGVLVGDVIARRRVELLPGAQLEGNVTSPRLAIADGGRIAGRCLTGAQALAAAPKSP
ncbi:MAG: polymer-forming cytoskeletal protein [Deltaproteobacteria bacterium]|nr:polymer-forming cytoskeletal protein [Deltaproteobacteria bacterium]